MEKIYNNIREFPKQFLWKPEIVNAENLPQTGLDAKITICGMGGSALAGDFIKTWLERTAITIHRDFGIPQNIAPDFVVTISYSGNTEETLSSFHEAREKKLPLLGIASGGALEKECLKHKIPFIKLPQGFQPREAMGFMVKALGAILAPDKIKELEDTGTILTESLEPFGKELAEKIVGKIPLIYTSPRMGVLGYNWKIRLNETGKTPAFVGIIPELFHNEMTGFDMGKKVSALKEKFFFVLLEDSEDTAAHQARFDAFETFFSTKGFLLKHIRTEKSNFCRGFFSSVSLADWTAYYLAKISGANPEEVLWVEEFKALVRKH